MDGGYVGQLLFVNLSEGTIKGTELDEKLAADFLGGYGIGASVLFDQVPQGADPLGPDNILGIVSGPLTGSGALIASRFMVVGKSPLTGGWGDANCGGYFGPELKAAGFDGVFFSGLSDHPVYLSIDNGRAELRDAAELWGQDTYWVDDRLKEICGSKAKVLCIGPAGEMQSLLAGIITDKGRAAARSGLGAVMGAKRLKAVVVRGDGKIPVAQPEKLRQLRQKYLPEFKSDFAKGLNKLGTAGSMEIAVEVGDAGVRNWAGAGSIDFPGAEKIGGEALLKLQKKKYGCFGCPISCGGWVEAPDLKGRPALSHKVQYETLGAFGSMCLNEDLESIIQANDLCNRYGIDTISVGDTIAFAMECYENGIIGLKDTDGLDLSWGNGQAVARLTEKICRREGFGAVLADGSKAAAERIGRNASDYAVHFGGQEVPMHDPRLFPGLLTTYLADPTPGRHTQGSEAWLPPGTRFQPVDRDQQHDLGAIHKYMVELYHVMSCAGLCLFGFFNIEVQSIAEFLEAVTGRAADLSQWAVVGERIANQRHLFNLREGVNFRDWPVHGRMLGQPPLTAGPHQGFSLDGQALISDYLSASGWDRETAFPSREKLLTLGLEEGARILYPES